MSQGNGQKTGPPQAKGTRMSDPGRAGLVREALGQGPPGTLLQTRRPSRQRQLLQSSTQELPCGKGTPCDQQDLPNTSTVRRGSGGVSGGNGPWSPGLARPAWRGPDPEWCSPPTLLAPWASPAWWAAAAIAVDLIHTRGPVSAGRGLALVNVCRTDGAQRAARRPVPRREACAGPQGAGSRPARVSEPSLVQSLSPA